MVTLAAPAVAANGKQLLPAGTELVAMDAGDRLVFCEATPRKASAGAMFLMGSLGETASCLTDSRKSGSFDGYFAKKVQYEGFPVIRGGLPAAAKPLQPLAYSVRPGGATTGGYWVGIRYLGGGDAAGPQRFQIAFGGRDDKASLSDVVVSPAGALPRSVAVLGGSVTILAAQAGTIQYRIDQAMPEQEFSVIRTISVR